MESLRIVMYVAGMPFNGATIASGNSLGGSETAGYEMAKELAKLGHKVTIFTTSQETGTWDKVDYKFCGQPSDKFPLGDQFHHTAQIPHDVTIIQRLPMAFKQSYNSKLNIWWTHDLALKRTKKLIEEQLVNIDQILTVSEFHRQQVAEVYDIDPDFITATTNGVDYSMFSPSEDREPNSLIFAARPERGLENLVAIDGIMEKLPDCHLCVCTYDNVAPHMKSYYEQLWRRCEELPNVTNVGNLGKKELYELMGKCELYVYPTTFEDTSCIAAIEASASGLPVIGCKVGALPETVSDGGAVLLPLKKGQVDKDAFVSTIKNLLADKEELSKLRDKALSKHQSWNKAAIQWEQLFERLFKEKTSNKYRLHRHLERNSDIVAAVKDGADKTLPDIKKNYYFYFENCYKEHYKKYYEREKKNGVNYGPESLTGNDRFEMVAEIIKKISPRTILDYGCAHGHYTINLLKRYGWIEKACGVDLSESNIKIAKKWAYDAGLAEKTEFIFGNHKSITGKYELIIAAEVLEHVPDPLEIVNTLKEHLTDNGYLIITTPYGPWEAIGYKDNDSWRAHIHHFEAQDLIDLFGTQRDFQLYALPYKDDLGNHICVFQPDKPFGEINYNRKFKIQSPKESLSVCIAAEKLNTALLQTLDSVRNIADEIIVGLVDVNYSHPLPLSLSDIIVKLAPIKNIGWGEAKNTLLEQASMDWILFLEPGEILVEPENLNKYLKRNCFNGYEINCGSCVPPDFTLRSQPKLRLFRADKGIKFFGHIAETPECYINGGIGKTKLIDVAIVKQTEISKVNKFVEEFSLVQKEIKDYPNRIVGWPFIMLSITNFILHLAHIDIGDPRIAEGIKLITGMWHKLLDIKKTELLIESLPYYSEAVKLVGNGIHYSTSVAITKGEKVQPITIEGVFANAEVIKRFTNCLQDWFIKDLEGKYY